MCVKYTRGVVAAINTIGTTFGDALMTVFGSTLFSTANAELELNEIVKIYVSCRNFLNNSAFQPSIIINRPLKELYLW
jgi:hypothetical protein